MRFLESIVFLLAGGLLGIFFYTQYLASKNTDVSEAMPADRQEVLIKKIEKVRKLVTIEGSIDITNEYKDEGWGFGAATDKSIQVKTSATVLVGFDLKALAIRPDSTTKTLYVSNLPQAQILAVEQEFKFSNLKEGFFRSFSAQDFTEIQDINRSRILEEAKKGGFVQQAQQEGYEILQVMRLITEQAGWKMVLENQGSEPNTQTPKHIPNAELPTPASDSLKG